MPFVIDPSNRRRAVDEENGVSVELLSTVDQEDMICVYSDGSATIRTGLTIGFRFPFGSVPNEENPTIGISASKLQWEFERRKMADVGRNNGIVARLLEGLSTLNKYRLVGDPPKFYSDYEEMRARIQKEGRRPLFDMPADAELARL